METTGERKPWYKRTKYVILIVILVILLIASFVPQFIHTPVGTNQARLNLTIDYLAHNYNSTTGLIREYPLSHTYWLYSDNYLAVLALERYDPGNASTTGFAVALNAALEGYIATAPPSLMSNQYTALNSTSASFDCSANYGISWAQQGKLVGSNTATSIMTTSNDLSPSCASQNYADLYLLQALYYHRLGNSSGATYYFDKASKDFNGLGITDLASNSTMYQTYKLALFVYTSSCLGQQLSSSFASAQTVLFGLQDNSTGGFNTGYTVSGATNHSVNTETTALAALALEQIIKPSSSC